MTLSDAISLAEEFVGNAVQVQTDGTVRRIIYDEAGRPPEGRDYSVPLGQILLHPLKSLLDIARAVTLGIKIHMQQPLYAGHRRYKNWLGPLAFSEYDGVRFERGSPCCLLFLGCAMLGLLNLATGLFNGTGDAVGWKV
jgi:hypothetical protein